MGSKGMGYFKSTPEFSKPPALVAVGRRKTRDGKGVGRE